jgi:hypothetical protein
MPMTPHLTVRLDRLFDRDGVGEVSLASDGSAASDPEFRERAGHALVRPVP